MYKNILVPVDLGDAARAKAILTEATKLVDHGGTITALHVVPEIPTYGEAYIPPEVYTRNIDGAQSEVESLAATFGGDIRREVRTGVPHVHILDYAEEIGADLIIIGSHKPGLADYFLGSTAARVVRHAKCSVLVDR